MSAETMLYSLGPDGEATPIGLVRDVGFLPAGQYAAEVHVPMFPPSPVVTVSVPLESLDVDLLALLCCQLDPTHDVGHVHDGRTCVPMWIRLGES